MCIRDREKADKSRRELNARLEKHGLIITSVIPGAFQFYKEYESKINEKKLADQEVEEQKSKANAATQAQEHQRVEATKKKEVAIAEFAGSMKELIVQADADAEKVMKEADAYAIEKQIGADAEYYQREKNAQAILATAKTEAEGLRKMAEALTGEGGVNIVKMEYARRLQTMTITGQPFVREGLTERFEHTQYPAAASPRRATTPGKGQ